ncbi:MAG: redox-sensitive bicupin YhaK (pirin superfamily) [Candidatus Marinamargulisbacteria bacterium]|jgi:redox-sensitive bicupin YhaK (pirin superfamily)
MQPSPRTLKLISTARHEEVAPGFMIKRPIPIHGVGFFDPFLLLDHMGPKDLKAKESSFVPDHPHRGFQPITLLFDGEAEHQDSLGNQETLHAGDVQWITAGSGLIHSEKFGNNTNDIMPFHAVQLWINLPANEKMNNPDYHFIPGAEIPKLDKEGHTIRLIAGYLDGQSGAHTAKSPILLCHVSLSNTTSLSIPIPENDNCGIYVLKGEASLPNDKAISQYQLAVTEKDGTHIEVSTPGACELLILSGTPLDEPIANYGPFVMNTDQEIQEAISDFQSGKMGQIKPSSASS